MSSMIGAFFDSGAFLPLAGAITGAAVCSRGGPTAAAACAGAGMMLGSSIQASINSYRMQERTEQHSREMLGRMNQSSGSQASPANAIPRDLLERQIKLQEDQAARAREQMEYMRQRDAKAEALNRAMLERQGIKLPQGSTLDDAFGHPGAAAQPASPSQAPASGADKPAAAAAGSK
jgi:hypothetical protein